MDWNSVNVLIYSAKKTNYCLGPNRSSLISPPSYLLEEWPVRCLEQVNDSFWTTLSKDPDNLEKSQTVPFSAAVSPLERLKILWMCGHTHTSQGVVSSLRHILQTEGVLGFFRGNAANMYAFIVALKISLLWMPVTQTLYVYHWMCSCLLYIGW